MLYDQTCGPLTLSWQVGGALYRGLGRIDAYRGARSWAEGLDWLACHRPGEPIAEIQFWGHGRWGLAKLAVESLDLSALRPGHPLHPSLEAIRERLVKPEGLWWFRTCETFGREEGHAFARGWTRFFGCRAAGHTFVIGPF